MDERYDFVMSCEFVILYTMRLLVCLIGIGS